MARRPCYLTDANMKVTCLADTGGDVAERAKRRAERLCEDECCKQSGVRVRILWGKK